jgi:hypothetical protein
MNHWICQVSLIYVFAMLLPALYHSNDALPSPYQVTLVGHYFSAPRSPSLGEERHGRVGTGFSPYINPEGLGL